jgi:hypothetical protein
MKFKIVCFNVILASYAMAVLHEEESAKAKIDVMAKYVKTILDITETNPNSFNRESFYTELQKLSTNPILKKSKWLDHIKDFSQIKSYVDNNDINLNNTLIILDLDDVVVTNISIGSANKETGLPHPYIESVRELEGTVKFIRSEKYYLNYQAPLDLNFVDTINYFQEKGATVICLTITGTQRSSTMDTYFKTININLEKNAKQFKDYTINTIIDKERFGKGYGYKKYIIYCDNYREKGYHLKLFYNENKEIFDGFKHVIFVDDFQENLESVKSTLRELQIDYTMIHYIKKKYLDNEAITNLLNFSPEKIIKFNKNSSIIIRSNFKKTGLLFKHTFESIIFDTPIFKNLWVYKNISKNAGFSLEKFVILQYNNSNSKLEKVIEKNFLDLVIEETEEFNLLKKEQEKWHHKINLIISYFFKNRFLESRNINTLKFWETAKVILERQEEKFVRNIDINKELHLIEWSNILDPYFKRKRISTLFEEIFSKYETWFKLLSEAEKNLKNHKDLTQEEKENIFLDIIITTTNLYKISCDTEQKNFEGDIIHFYCKEITDVYFNTPIKLLQVVKNSIEYQQDMSAIEKEKMIIYMNSLMNLYVKLSHIIIVPGHKIFDFNVLNEQEIENAANIRAEKIEKRIYAYIKPFNK